jgi:hypothetical protein
LYDEDTLIELIPVEQDNTTEEPSEATGWQ